MTVSAADGGGCGRGFRLQVTGPIEWCHGLIFRRTETNGQWTGAVVFDFQHDAIFVVAVLLAGVKLDYRTGQCYDVLHTPWGYVKWGCRFMPRKAMSKLSTPKTHGKSAGIGLARAHGQGVSRVGSGGKALAVDPDKKIGNLHRLKRIEGQIRGLHDMVKRDRYCADILIQIAAVQKSLASVARQVLGNHLKHCVSQNIRAGGAQADAACEELLKLLSHIDR